ncbi:DUF2288 domain-containing protein [Lyngbya confervoides]|uniref:DUF2288 domain-containing protein n=1 Tax=Lyngbya confervoides BDU141951 TaxID=1574623 RepID=A0ABD4T0C0_9CYAN|nr:DUF2288 domain-containing protein [Lyngbya confervoides]MCM1982176.1 DUF2288 domain-containing protein [Lyngbya confervoides BDU141951]
MTVPSSSSQPSVASQLAEDLALVSWSDLKPHANRDALVVVHPTLDLVAVATAIAQDQVSQVQHWIQEGLIQKPTLDQLQHWNEQPQTLFPTLIVQPYVLIVANPGS